jgi:hypothetical protein
MSTHDQQPQQDQYPTEVRARHPEPTITGREESARESGPGPEFEPQSGTMGSGSSQPTVDQAHLSSAPAESGGASVDSPTGRVDGSRSESESPSETALFADDELAGLRARWDSVQAGFVDDPKDCVQKADGLVSDVVGQLTSGFTQARARLEDQWGRGEEASTEDLRVALRRYRDFFERLLAV